MSTWNILVKRYFIATPSGGMFIDNLKSMIKDGQIIFGKNGADIIITSPEFYTAQNLKKYNIRGDGRDSFRRQLNLYNFYKVNGDLNDNEFEVYWAKGFSRGKDGEVEIDPALFHRQAKVSHLVTNEEAARLYGRGPHRQAREVTEATTIPLDVDSDVKNNASKRSAPKSKSSTKDCKNKRTCSSPAHLLEEVKKQKAMILDLQQAVAAQRPQQHWPLQNDAHQQWTLHQLGFTDRNALVNECPSASATLATHTLLPLQPHCELMDSTIHSSFGIPPDLDLMEGVDDMSAGLGSDDWDVSFDQQQSDTYEHEIALLCCRIQRLLPIHKSSLILKGEDAAFFTNVLQIHTVFCIDRSPEGLDRQIDDLTWALE